MKERMSETVITHAFVYSSLSVSPGLLLRDLKMFTYLNLLLREIKHSQCQWMTLGCVCSYSLAFTLLQLLIYLLMYFTFHHFMYVCYACYHFHHPITLSNPPFSCWDPSSLRVPLCLHEVGGKLCQQQGNDTEGPPQRIQGRQIHKGERWWCPDESSFLAEWEGKNHKTKSFLVLERLTSFLRTLPGKGFKC